ncbi:oxidoreductase [Caryophanon latum]|uniref:Oxidoreductase n=1 Tax=Caryophanon latum TaxID=33977 RepID=A0A1C0Z4C2_9BACL|nr:oxidoreductase [Caryophanon latum]OCS94297.1 oxidoreductase [Caryophanon latum]
MKMRAAIVVGATGLTGRTLIEQLCESEEYVAVIAIARRKLTFEHPKLEVRVKSFDELEEDDLPPANDLFCCLGTTRKKAGSKEAFEQVDFEYPLRIASLAKKKGIPHFVVISAMGAKESSPFYYSRVKGKLEKELIDLQLDRLTIVRPSLITGDRDEFRLGERVGAGTLAVTNPLLAGPLKKYRSIEASQLALAMICIALYERPQKVGIYESNRLLTIMPPALEEEEEIEFNWSKLEEKRLEEENGTPIDEEVVFDRTKFHIVTDDDDSHSKD